MGLVNKKYVVLIDNGTNGKTDEVCYMRSVRRNGKTFYEFSPLRTKAHHFTTKANADKCCKRLKEGGYLSWVEVFYKL